MKARERAQKEAAAEVEERSVIPISATAPEVSNVAPIQEKTVGASTAVKTLMQLKDIPLQPEIKLAEQPQEVLVRPVEKMEDVHKPKSGKQKKSGRPTPSFLKSSTVPAKPDAKRTTKPKKTAEERWQKNFKKKLKDFIRDNDTSEIYDGDLVNMYKFVILESETPCLVVGVQSDAGQLLVDVKPVVCSNEDEAKFVFDSPKTVLVEALKRAMGKRGRPKDKIIMAIINEAEEKKAAKDVNFKGRQEASRKDPENHHRDRISHKLTRPTNHTWAG